MKQINALQWAWICIALFLPTCLLAQNPLWTFPEQQLNFTNTGATDLPTSPGNYSGIPAGWTHAGYQDPYGDLMFFKVDDYIYDEFGSNANWFYDGNDPISGTSETLIVPEPGSCNRFYIFHTEAEQNFTDDQYPHVSIYDDSLSSLLYDDTIASKTSWNLVTDLNNIANWGTTEHGLHGVHFAATSENDDGERKIFIANNNRIYRSELTCNGLQTSGWSFDIHSSDHLVENGWRTELELFEDTANNSIKIAHPYYLTDAANGHIKIVVIEVDSASGDYINGSRLDIQIENINASGTPAYVHGIEFTPDGEGLYIMHEPTPNYPSPLSFYNFNTSALTNLNCTNMSDFTKSQLQINGDSANYTLYMASDENLGALDDPNNPNCSNWTWNAIPLNSYGTNNGSTGVYFVGGKKHIVPDQVDYQDYNETFLDASCDCCYKYAYAEEMQDTSYSAIVPDTWGPGITNNPWDAAANDTIFIRDSLFIPKGLSVTITDLNFAFGRDAVVVLERGDSSTPGAVLSITDSTLFTFDFRCSDREYNCTDPSDEDCDRKYWQGVRVEGSPAHGQSLTGFTRQSKFYMDNGSKIEYANVGILAGHERFSNYGGGIVRIDESFMKDNITGARFDPYVRMVSGQEVMTLSEIEDMNFTWTEELPSESEPFRHIDIRELSGLQVRAGVFQNENHQAYLPGDRGIGIYSANSRLKCTWYCDPFPSNPCASEDERRPEFLNLHRGVEGLGLSERLIEVYYATFTNNVAGVFLSNQINPRILDNEFYIPDEDNNYGLFLGSSTGYAVENNYFTAITRRPSSWCYGISVMSSGSAMNEIYNNVFEDITIGIINSKQNANCSNLDEGLEWRCNEFNQYIPYADIFVATGIVSDDQGSCAYGLSTSPAGNVFSHSHGGSSTAGPYDIKVDENNQPYMDCPGSPPLEIEYRHHGSLSGPYQARMEPIVYTQINGHVQVGSCPLIPVDGNTCQVQNTSVPSGTGGPKSGGQESDDESANFWQLDSLTFVDLEQRISDHYTAKEEALAILDNGNTHELLEAIANDAFDVVNELLGETGDMLSYRVVEALVESENEAFVELGLTSVSALVDQEVTDSTYQMVNLPSWETEATLSELEAFEPHLWRKLIFCAQTDTLGEFTNEGVMGLFTTYQPKACGHRYVAALAEKMGMEEPVWIDENNSLNQEVQAYSLPETADGLPRDVYNYVSPDFYNDHSNMADLNAAYVAAAASYDPPLFEFPDIELPEPPEDSDKSNKTDIRESESEIKVMPNPFDDLVTFDFSELTNDENDMQLVFYDVVGRRIHSQVIPAGQRFVQVQGNKLSDGLIHYTLISQGVRIESGTIVKMK